MKEGPEMNGPPRRKQRYRRWIMEEIRFFRADRREHGSRKKADAGQYEAMDVCRWIMAA